MLRTIKASRTALSGKLNSRFERGVQERSANPDLTVV
jgi:hypothetical protein